MTEKLQEQSTENQAELLLHLAEESLSGAQESSRKVQELNDRLAAGRSAVEALIGTLFAAKTEAAETFAAAAAAAEEQQDQVEEQLESLADRLDTVFDVLEDVAGTPAPAVLSAELDAAVAEPAEAENAAISGTVEAEATAETAPQPAWFDLPVGVSSLSALAAEVEEHLQHLGDELAEQAEAAAEQVETLAEQAEAKLEDKLGASLQQTLLQISSELAALNLLADEPAEDAVVEDVVVEDAVIEEPAPAEEVPVAAPLREVAAAYPGYNPTWMVLAPTESTAEPAEAPTTPLQQNSPDKKDSTFAPAWFKATEEKEANAVRSAAVAEAAPAAPLVDEDDPVEIAARALEARRMQEEAEKKAAELAEAERMRLKAEEELHRILQEIESEKQNNADDDIAALLRGYKH